MTTDLAADHIIASKAFISDPHTSRLGVWCVRCRRAVLADSGGSDERQNCLKNAAIALLENLGIA